MNVICNTYLNLMIYFMETPSKAWAILPTDNHTEFLERMEIGIEMKWARGVVTEWGIFCTSIDGIR